MPDPDLPPIGQDDLDAARERTVARGTAIRRRRRAGLAASSVLALGLIVGAATAFTGDGTERVDVASDDDSTTTTIDATTTSTTYVPDTTLPVDTATTAPPTTRPPAATTLPPHVITPTGPPEPQCATVTGEGSGPNPSWPTMFQTEPAYNDPATVTFCIDDVTPAVGQLVTATITTTDPDAPYLDECEALVGWRGGFATFCRDTLGMSIDPHPFPTPPERPGSYSATLTNVYDEAGEFDVEGIGWSGEVIDQDPPDGSFQRSPYASIVTAIIHVVVT